MSSSSTGSGSGSSSTKPVSKDKDRDPKKPATRGKDSPNEGKKEDSAAAVRSIQVDATNFPPLPAVDTPIPTPGYKGEYVKYSIDQMLEVVSHVKNAVLPATIHPVRTIIVVVVIYNTIYV